MQKHLWPLNNDSFWAVWLNCCYPTQDMNHVFVSIGYFGSTVNISVFVFKQIFFRFIMAPKSKVSDAGDSESLEKL